MKLALMCLSISSCFASVHFDLSGGAGYRRDWHEIQVFDSNDPSFKSFDEKIHGVNIAQVEGRGALWIDRFLLEADADFGWVVNGKDRLINAENALPPISSTFHSHVKGHVYDTSLFAGYHIYLNRSPTFSFSLIPEVGYAFYAQHLNRHHTKPKLKSTSPSSTALGGTPVQSIAASFEYKSDLKRNWYGPFVGCEFFFRFNSKVDFFVGYSYQWLTMNYHDHVFRAFQGRFAQIPDSTFMISDNAKFSCRYTTNSAQKGWAKISYEVAPRWTVELYSSFLSFILKPKKLKSKDQQNINFNFSGQQIDQGTFSVTKNRSKGNWQSFVIEAFATYQF